MDLVRVLRLPESRRKCYQDGAAAMANSINLVIHIFNAHRVLDDIVVVWHVCLVDRCQEGAISSRMSSRERKVLDLLANIIESDTKTLTELS